MKTYGLIGYRLGHSFSKGYFTQKFSNENISDCVYQNFELDAISEFPTLLTNNPTIQGLNCTIPYKKDVMVYLDEIDEEAAQIGAVNVIKVTRTTEGVKLKGYNSDAFGFEMSLKPLLQTQHQKALVLGTGGAAQAVVFILQKLGLEVTIVSRNANPSKGIISYEQLTPEVMTSHKLIVNATPVGTFPNISECPNIPYKRLTSEYYLYDLIYNPELTTFLKQGKERGSIIKNGGDMLRLQAERAWEIWEGNY
ncbi:MAG: shikimate dehydrogenase family protein [Mangrovibacterium sp.]